jgi:hypothetical protein
MKKVTTYRSSDLTHGKCTCCGETSSEIVIGENMCADCVQMIEFEMMLMMEEEDE